ncbi:hypothetical protein MOF32_11730 [Priestia megaterium]|uniref:hypothetical protein n=1 Tax=Priestia megaterium TaxID=1404 RepID=UPI00227FF99A|nr:hypothetical protein [Priestia megaterium]MCY9020282.1 hypothetical protein [Priestia megaterium]MCY9023625.1 hypothetical protein [Priestia megaterium]
MSPFFLAGMVLVLVMIVFSRTLWVPSGMVERLSKKKRFQNHWLSGGYLFGINALYFGATMFLLYLLMFLATIVSILTWSAVSAAWTGSFKNRLKMALTGSSFYLIVAFIMVIEWLSVKPLYPHEDTFMRALGWMLGFFVSAVAFSICFIFTAFLGKRSARV